MSLYVEVTTIFRHDLFDAIFDPHAEQTCHLMSHLLQQVTQ